MANNTFQIQKSYQFNNVCNIHFLPKDRITSNQANQLFFYCSECEKQLNLSTLSIQSIKDFKNYLKAFVKGSVEELTNLKIIYEKMTIINDIKQLQQILSAVSSDIQKYVELFNQLIKIQFYNDSTLTQIFQQFKSKQIKEENIKNGNLFFKGVVERMKIIKSALKIIQNASEQLQELFTLPVKNEEHPQQQNFMANHFPNQHQQQPQNNNINTQVQENRNPFRHQQLQPEITKLSDKNFKKFICQDFEYDKITINSVSFNESETLLIIGTDTCTIENKSYYIQVWEINPEFLTNQNYLSGHNRTVKIVKFIEEKRFISGGIDTKILIWKEEGTGKWVVEQILSGHSICVNGIEYVKSQFIVSCSQEMILWKEDYCQNNQYSEITRADGFKQIISSLTFIKGDFNHLFVSYSNFIELYKIDLDSFVKIKTMKTEETIQNLMSLDDFDFISLHKNYLLLWEQKESTYVKTKFQEQESIKCMSSYDYNKSRLASICFNKICSIFQIQSNNNQGYLREKIIDLEGRFCFFSQKSPKFCLITQNQIIIYTFKKTNC